MALFYTINGTISSIQMSTGPDGKMTASAEIVPTIPTSSATAQVSSSNFTSSYQTTLSNVTPTPVAFGADDVNTAYTTKYPARVEANFAYNYVSLNYEIVPGDSVFNPNFAFNNIRISTDAFPGGGSGALSFNGVDQYFTALNSDVINWLPGTGAFTIEFFIKKGDGGSGAPRVFSLGNDTGATIGVSIEGGTCYVWPYGLALSGAMPSGYEAGTDWAHVAICRSGTTTKLFIDGVLKATKTNDTRNITDALNPGFDLNVGVDDPEGNANFWSGNLTNFRWDNSAIYTGASLVVPTAPLTKTATTKLLMLGGGSTNPVYDAAKLNNLVNHGAQWTSDTPF